MPQIVHSDPSQPSLSERGVSVPADCRQVSGAPIGRKQIGRAVTGSDRNAATAAGGAIARDRPRNS